MATLHDYDTIMALDLTGYTGNKVSNYEGGSLQSTQDTRVLDKELKKALLLLNTQMEGFAASGEINCLINLKAYALLTVQQELRLGNSISGWNTQYGKKRDAILNCVDLAQLDRLDKTMAP